MNWYDLDHGHLLFAYLAAVWSGDSVNFIINMISSNRRLSNNKNIFIAIVCQHIVFNFRSNPKYKIKRRKNTIIL